MNPPAQASVNANPIRLCLKCAGEECEQRLVSVHTSGPALLRVPCPACRSLSEFEWGVRGWDKRELRGRFADGDLTALRCPACEESALISVHMAGPAFLELLYPCPLCKATVAWEWTSRGWRGVVTRRVEA